ncbi:MAG: NAD-dependent epimerase/dehydratase family protein [Paracoccaceae bacterium]
MAKTALILGASGKLGIHSAKAFEAAGWNIRLYDRKTGDMTRQAQGVDVIMNGLNPPNYHNWAQIIPQITAQVIAAAKSSGARVVIPGNVYNFGKATAPWSEETPQTPSSRKGQIRVDMEAAYRNAGVKTLILRAGNLIDPDRNGCVMSLVYLTSIKKGKITSPGGFDTLQAFAYVPDWARAMVALCDAEDRLERFEDVPFAGHSFTPRELATGLSAALDREIKIAGFPWWVMGLASPFWELARELREMRYLWNHPHSMSGEKLARLLPDFKPTPLHEVMIAALPPQIHPSKRMAAGTALPAA